MLGRRLCWLLAVPMVGNAKAERTPGTTLSGAEEPSPPAAVAAAVAVYNGVCSCACDGRRECGRVRAGVCGARPQSSVARRGVAPRELELEAGLSLAVEGSRSPDWGSPTAAAAAAAECECDSECECEWECECDGDGSRLRCAASPILFSCAGAISGAGTLW